MPGSRISGDALAFRFNPGELAARIADLEAENERLRHYYEASEAKIAAVREGRTRNAYFAAEARLATARAALQPSGQSERERLGIAPGSIAVQGVKGEDQPTKGSQ